MNLDKRIEDKVESYDRNHKRSTSEALVLACARIIELEDAQGDKAIQAAVDAERAFLIGRCNRVSAAAAKEPNPNAIDCIGTILGIIRTRISHPAPQGEA